jgi:predicted nucleic acid-binding protein
VVPLDTKIALLAADMYSRYRLGTADAIVYAAAVAHGADLLTCDGHFDGLPCVTFIPKIGG